jgi:hypothetical protein
MCQGAGQDITPDGQCPRVCKWLRGRHMRGLNRNPPHVIKVGLVRAVIVKLRSLYCPAPSFLGPSFRSIFFGLKNFGGKWKGALPAMQSSTHFTLPPGRVGGILRLWSEITKEAAI